MTHRLLQKIAAFAGATLMTAVTLGAVDLMATGQQAALRIAAQAAAGAGSAAAAQARADGIPTPGSGS